MKIIVATLKNLDVLTRMNVSLRADEQIDNVMTDAQVRERMRGFLDGNYKAYLFVQDDNIVGYSLVDHSKNPLYMRQFFIERAWRRKGLGTAMFHLLMKQLKTTCIDLEVFSWYAPAIQFYEKLGFRTRCFQMRLGEKKEP